MMLRPMMDLLSKTKINTLENKESEITENEEDEVVVYCPGQYDDESRSQ